MRYAILDVYYLDNQQSETLDFIAYKHLVITKMINIGSKNNNLDLITKRQS